MRRIVHSPALVSLVACGGGGDRPTGPAATTVSASIAPPPPTQCDQPTGVRGVGLDMVPGSSTNTIGFNTTAQVTFAILSSRGASPPFDVRDINPGKVTLGNGDGNDTPLARNANGTPKFVLTYVNGDDFMLDFYGYVDKTAMKTNGDLTLLNTKCLTRNRVTERRHLAGRRRG
jgi:hypothetical protein